MNPESVPPRALVFIFLAALLLAAPLSPGGAAPDLTSVLLLEDCHPQDMTRVGSALYILDTFKGLLVADARGGLAPVAPGLVRTALPRRVQTRGDLLFFSDDNGFHVADIRDRRRPLLLRSVPLRHASGFAVRGGYAFVGSEGFGLQVVDLRLPAQAQVVKKVPSLDIVYAVDLAGDFAVLACSGGIQVIDVTDPTRAALAQSIRTEDDNRDLAVSGGFAYVAAGAAGLRVVDVRVPRRASILRDVPTAGYAWAVTAVSGYVFVSNVTLEMVGNAGVSIFPVRGGALSPITASIDRDAQVFRTLVAEGDIFLSHGYTMRVVKNSPYAIR